jgi:glutaminyl-tRNA synthetase
VEAEVRLYDRLFSVEDPGKDEEQGVPFTAHLNPGSLEVLSGARLEPTLAEVAPGQGVQFERLGYFCVDPVETRPGRSVWNRTIGLRDSWAKLEKGGKAK